MIKKTRRNILHKGGKFEMESQNLTDDEFQAMKMDLLGR